MQEKEKAAEEHKQNIAEYRKFLESCDFIKVSLVKGMRTCILLLLILSVTFCHDHHSFAGEQPVAESSRSFRG